MRATAGLPHRVTTSPSLSPSPQDCRLYSKLGGALRAVGSAGGGESSASKGALEKGVLRSPRSSNVERLLSTGS